MRLKENASKILNSPYFRLNSTLAFLVSLSYILLILGYTRGALLYGGDFVGYYSQYSFISDPNLNSLSFSLGILLALGNYYAGLYIALLMSTFVTLLSISFLSREMFRNSQDSKQEVVIGTLASILYLFNPVSYTDTFKSLTANVYLENAAFFVFLAEVVRLWRSLKKERVYHKKDAFVFGLSLALSSDAFPNDVRTIAIGLILASYFVAIALSSEIRKGFRFRISLVLEYLGLGIVGLLIGGIYYLAPMIISPSRFISTASQGAQNLSSLSFIVGSFNTLPQVFRLIGSWAFTSVYAPYQSIYFQPTVVMFASFLWPILAIGSPILLSRGREKQIILAFEFVMIAMIFWEKASNPPLGLIWGAIVAHLPFGAQLFPTFFMTTVVLSKLYPLMAAYSIARLARIKSTNC